MSTTAHTPFYVELKPAAAAICAIARAAVAKATCLQVSCTVLIYTFRNLRTITLTLQIRPLTATLAVFILTRADATVYVGGLDEECDEELLWELMLQAGPVGT